MAKVTRERPETTVEREIATGLIVDDIFLRQAQSVLSCDLLKTELLRWVWRWATDYYQRYEQAPRRDIQSIFETQRDNLEEPELIEKFLARISGQYEHAGFNREYVLDKASDYARKRKVEETLNIVKAAYSRGDMEGAESAIVNYQPPCAETVEGFNPFLDEKGIFAAHEPENDVPLIRFPGEFGRFVNKKMVREGFVGILGPKKRGKTFLLNEFAIRAARNGCRVVHFDCGDMGRRRMYQRIHTRLAGKSSDPSDCGWVRIPVLDCIYNQTDTCSLQQRINDIGLDANGTKEMDTADWPEGYRPCCPRRCGECREFKGAVSYHWRYIERERTGAEAVERGKRFVQSTYHDYRLYCYSNSTLTVREMENKLKSLEEFDDFLVDVIVIDYADIMAAEDTRKEFRQQVADTWNNLRRISQERKCLVIVATQSDTPGMDADILRPNNFTDFHRKIDPVTSFLGMNQKDSEKRQGIMRINELAGREDYFEITDTVSILQCLEIGNPFLDSFRTHNERGLA